MSRIRRHIMDMGLTAMLAKGVFDAALAIGAFWSGHMMFALGCAGGGVFWLACSTAFVIRRRNARSTTSVKVFELVEIETADSLA